MAALLARTSALPVSSLVVVPVARRETMSEYCSGGSLLSWIWGSVALP